jgi:hypothetical protein
VRIETHLHITRFLRGETDCLSVRDLPNGRVYHAEKVWLTDATFAVQPSGQRRFYETGHKNVHAFVRGQGAGGSFPFPFDPIYAGWDEATYNPTKHKTFVDRNTGAALHSADRVILVGNKVYYTGGK